MQDTPPWKRQLRKNVSESKTESKVEVKAFVDPKPKPTLHAKSIGSPKKDHKPVKYAIMLMLMC